MQTAASLPLRSFPLGAQLGLACVAGWSRRPTKNCIRPSRAAHEWIALAALESRPRSSDNTHTHRHTRTNTPMRSPSGASIRRRRARLKMQSHPRLPALGAGGLAWLLASCHSRISGARRLHTSGAASALQLCSLRRCKRRPMTHTLDNRGGGAPWAAEHNAHCAAAQRNRTIIGKARLAAAEWRRRQTLLAAKSAARARLARNWARLVAAAELRRSSLAAAAATKRARRGRRSRRRPAKASPLRSSSSRVLLSR
jgi:hypothetical protein